MLSQYDLLELFAEQKNWQDRYRQLILLSKQLPIFPDELKVEVNQVHGCENRAWIVHHKTSDNTYLFQGDSEGRIIKGLLAILFIFAGGKTADELKQFDFYSVFEKLKVNEELSKTRLSGLSQLIERIKAVE